MGTHIRTLRRKNEDFIFTKKFVKLRDTVLINTGIKSNPDENYNRVFKVNWGKEVHLKE